MACSILKIEFIRHRSSLLTLCLLITCLFYAPLFAYANPEQIETTENKLYPDIAIKVWKDNGRDEKISILFDSTHGYDLSIITPDGADYIIYDDFNTINPNKFSNFRNTRKTDIKISELVGIEFKNDQQNVEKIFQKKGLYCFHFSSNLEAFLGDTYFDLIAVSWSFQSTQIFETDDNKCLKHFALTP